MFILRFILGVLVITLFLDLFIRIKYNIDFGLYRPINNIQKWVERILILLYIVIIILVAFVFTLSYIPLYILLFGFFAILMGFRAFMEYKYEKEEREYITDFIWAIASCIIVIGSIFFIT